VRRLLVAAAVCAAGALPAQPLQPEIRVDLQGPRPISLAPGVGLTLPLGYYVRVGAAVGYAVPLESSATGSRWRTDLLARALFDPFRQQRWGLSIGGGLSYRRSRTSILAMLDLEGPEVRGVLPALQLGVSGGLRAGLVFRKAISGRR
jgi:hypothetical protein